MLRIVKKNIDIFAQSMIKKIHERGSASHDKNIMGKPGAIECLEHMRKTAFPDIQQYFPSIIIP